ncbi:MAG TPA: efflux transporter outer membrane subunit [Usitatibacter sp.]
MRALAALAAVALAGCAIGPDYSRPALDLPAGYPSGEASAAAQPAVEDKWWTLYGDATLDELVAAALAKNPDVEFAVARIEEANAQLREANAAFLPEIDASLNSSRSRVSAATAFPNPPPLVRNDVRGQLSTGFEIDLWGRLRRGDEAARALALGTRFSREVVFLTLEGLVAQTYFTVRSLDTQIDLSQRTLAARRDSLDVVGARVRGGLASDLDSNSASIAVADASLQVKELVRQRELAEHQLAVLTSRLDLKLEAAPAAKMPSALPRLPSAGLPSTLLERRPDIRQAEQSLVAANAQIGVAKAAYFPTVSLLAGDGGESTALATLVNAPARIWSVGLNAAMPLLDWGRTTARVDQAAARKDQAVATYRKVAETAFREVADALTEVRQASISQREFEDRAATANDTLRIVNARYRSGLSTYLEVLDAQRTANDAELSVARNRLALLNGSVSLMKALGGGWRPDAS